MQRLRVVNKGFNYGQDGPGNRLIYHLWGCNMRCPWCSNPETVYGERYEEVPVAEILRQAESARRIMIDGGGVTFTGGEPTLRFGALKKALAGLREAGIHTAIETNGATERLSELFPLLGLLIMDFKHWDDARHTGATGLSNRVILGNLRAACAAPLPVWVRTPLIGGFNAGPRDIEGFLVVYKTLELSNTSFELLPYHEYGRDKWEQCGQAYTVEQGAVPPALVSEFEQAFQDAGLHVIRT